MLMNINLETNVMTHDEVRWQIIRALLDEFPYLKEKVKAYLKD
jgi:hypothetical protein